MVSNVLNKNCEHWLLGDALQFVIIKIHEFCNYVVDLVVLDNMANPKANVCDAELKNLTIHMKHQMLEVLQPFLLFFLLHGFDKKKAHNMLVLILDPRLKSL